MAAKKITHIDSRGNSKQYSNAADIPDESARKLLGGTEATAARATEAATSASKKETK